MSDLLAWIDSLPAGVVYLTLGLGAAVENIVPAVPADTFVALGGFLSSVGDLDPRWIFFSTWTLNVGSALVTYRVGYVHGRPFFTRGWGSRLLRPRQMERMGVFYARWGTPAIFFTRFLPGLRSVVPIFAGVTHQPFILVALPVAAASAIWYAALVWLGIFAGQNLDALQGSLRRVNGVLAAVAVVVVLIVAAWWWRSRHPGDD